MQQRSAADVAIMKEIVRQVPELRPAVYSLIDRDISRALSTIEQVTPEQVPRKDGAWVPEKLGHRIHAGTGESDTGCVEGG
jgi:hypothetical protein